MVGDVEMTGGPADLPMQTAAATHQRILPLVKNNPVFFTDEAKAVTEVENLLGR